MPRVHQQIARKDYPEAGIKKGDTYYKWAFRYGGERKSKTYPRASQLTQSHWADVYAALESIEDCNQADAQEVADTLGGAVDAVEDVAGRYEEAAESMGGAGSRNEALASQLQELGEALRDLSERAQTLADGVDAEDGEEAEAETLEDIVGDALNLEWEPNE